MLFLSPHTLFEKGKPIRGGIPICFPWFGKHPTREDLLLHGVVRTQTWELLQVIETLDGATTIVLRTQDDENTRLVWPYRFSLQLTISIAQTLKLVLHVTNTDVRAFTFEEGFHTYFSVGSLAKCWIEGLDGLQVLNRARGDKPLVHSGPVEVSGEFVRIYNGVGPSVTLVDQSMKRSIRMEQRQLHQIFVWNPGEEKAMQNSEILDAWKNFLCVEHVNCLNEALLLEPGQIHESTLVLSVNP